MCTGLLGRSNDTGLIRATRQNGTDLLLWARNIPGRRASAGDNAPYWHGIKPAPRSVHLHMKRIMTVFKWPKDVPDVGMFDRLAGIVRNQVLF